MKTAKDILYNNSILNNSIDEDKMVIDAFNQMRIENLDYVLVTEANVCIGIVSEVDYMTKIILARKNPRHTKVKDIMTSRTCNVDIKDSFLKCLELMNTLKIRHLLVYEDSILKGVIRLRDLILAAFEEDIDSLLEEEQMNYSNSENI